MNQEQVCNLIEKEFRPLWPSWNINEAQLRVWINKLKPFKAAEVRQAANEHYASRAGVYLNPQLPAIVELAKKYQPRRTPVEVEPCNYDTDVFVQCIEHDNPIKLFQFFGVYVARQYQDNRDYILNAAECTRRKVESIYGGVWIVVQQTTHSAMRDELAEQRRPQSSKKQLSHQL
ncbi:MAG: hypothetical protein PVG93_00260 [Phycisphaerales bacterium]|jgi:hypothetical protein